jgi:glycosyltransferase involved in cell wall biosynthesis
VNEDIHPELVEHLGITPLEAMSAGVITFCYKAGGPKELIKDGENGYLFSSFEELTEKIKKVTIDVQKQKQVITTAHAFVKKYFSYSVFKEQVKNSIL